MHDNRDIDVLKKKFDDVWSASGSGRGFTFSSSNPTVRVDYIFVSKSGAPADSKTLQTAFRPVKAAVVASTASDHLPVQAEIRFVSE